MSRALVAVGMVVAFILLMRAVWWLVRDPGTPIEVVAE